RPPLLAPGARAPLGAGASATLPNLPMARVHLAERGFGAFEVAEFKDALQAGGVGLLHRRTNETAIKPRGEVDARARLAEHTRDVGERRFRLRPQLPAHLRLNDPNLLRAGSLERARGAVLENDLLFTLGFDGSGGASSVAHGVRDPWASSDWGGLPAQPDSRPRCPEAARRRFPCRPAPPKPFLTAHPGPARRLTCHLQPVPGPLKAPARVCIVPRCAGAPQACWRKRALRGCC